MMNLIKLAMAAAVLALAPASFAGKACDKCCKDKGKECKACCADAGKKCGTDCCKEHEKK
jgi:hypothetical protein